MISTLLSVIIVLCVCGIVLYLFNLFVPMDPKFKNAVYALVCLAAFIYILQMLGWLPHQVPRFK